MASLPQSQPVTTAFDNGSTTTNASSYATTSKTFTAGRLYVLMAGTTATTPLDPTSVKFTVATTAWALVAAGQKGTVMDVTLWVINPAANVTDTVTIDFNAVNQTGFDWVIFEITNWNSVVTAANAILQNKAASASSASPSVTLTNAPTPGNLTLGFCLQNANAAFTAGGNFTKVTETAGHSSPTSRGAGEKDNGTAQQTINWTITSAQWCAWGIEIQGLEVPSITQLNQSVRRMSIY